MVFRSPWQVRNEQFYYNGNLVEIVNTFSYLGLLLHYNGKFNVTQKHIAEMGKKALFCLMKKVKNHNFNVSTLLSLFDIYVSPILHYCSELWGYIKAQDMERVHTMFLKRLLGVKRSTSNDMVYCKMGRLPLFVQRQFNILKYWLKLLKTDNCILKGLYDNLVCTHNENNVSNWASEVRKILINTGMIYVWDQQKVENEKLFLLIAKQRLGDLAFQSIDSYIERSNKCLIYKHISKHRSLPPYLNSCIPTKCKKIISKFRLSAHTLSIETGRYDDVNRDERKCIKCNLQDTEDEFHFILKCPYYHDIRTQYIKRYYTYSTYRPSVYKVTQLLGSNKKRTLCSLGKYLIQACERRDSTETSSGELTQYTRSVEAASLWRRREVMTSR